MSRPSSCAYFSRFGRSSACWLANILSCISQNLPCSLRGLGGDGGVSGVVVEGQGQVLEGDLDVVLVGLEQLLDASAPTRLQKGHWNSENSTMVTLGALAPVVTASPTATL